MRRPILPTLLTLALIGTLPCLAGDAVPAQGFSDGTADPRLVAEDLIVQSGWPAISSPSLIDLEPGDATLATGDCRPILDFTREVLVDDIAHYTADVRVGPGPFDVIRIHRVVKETRPYSPERTRMNVFLLHGDGVGFVKFLFGTASPSTPDEHAAAIYLAQNGVDVWGMDQDWILVPMDTTDFSFMEDQGLQHQVDNVLYAVQIARYTRLFTGNGYGKVNLLGYSSGAATVYAAANQEAVLPPGLRHVGGLIPVDLPYKLAPEYEPGRQAACACVNDYVALIDSGVYADTGGILFVTLGDLALNDPAGDSPVLPGLTNRQAAIFFGGAIYNFFPLTDWWHYWGGVLVFDDLGLPVDFEFTPTQAAFEFLLTASPYEPGKFILDYCEVLCDETDVPFDDNLGEVTIPVLYIGGAGGLGKSGFYATTLLGSEDITLLNPALRDPADIAYDIGHIDIWTADDAPSLFWGPLLDWIDDHTPGN